MILEICTIQDIPCFHYKLCYLFNFSNFPTIYTKDLEMFLSVDIFIDHMPKSLVKVRVPLDSVFSVILKM